jgi:hypothetical protein
LFDLSILVLLFPANLYAIGSVYPAKPCHNLGSKDRTIWVNDASAV